VLELGSGTGIVGLVAAILKGTITLTDREEILPLMRENTDLNFAQDADTLSRISLAK